MFPYLERKLVKFPVTSDYSRLSDKIGLQLINIRGSVHAIRDKVVLININRYYK